MIGAGCGRKPLCGLRAEKHLGNCNTEERFRLGGELPNDTAYAASSLIMDR